MLFNSYEFLFGFLPMTFAGFFLIARYVGRRPALVFLALASIIFYGWWNWRYVPLLVLSIVVNFLVARGILATQQRPRSAIFFAGVAFDLGLLGYFKYANFFVDSINAASGSDLALDPIILPIGISFFTFTQIAYLADAYANKASEYDFGRYLLFVTYFPHLISGPILHHREMMPQFADPAIYRLKIENLATGLTILVIGLVKKLAIADQIAVYATPVFDGAEIGAVVTFASAWQGTLAYTLQIYFDFSGYSDMAIGLSLLFGVKLPLNFNSPYKSTDIIEFWRRWHMTLSRFLRNYLYIPLGGNRKGPTRRFVNLLTTMLLGGIWHGAGWTFVAWGALHGLYLVINHVWRGLLGEARCRKLAGRTTYVVMAWSITFLAVVVAWVFFRATTFSGAMTMLAAMGGMNGVTGFETIRAKVYVLTPLFLAIALLAPNTQQIMRAWMDRTYYAIESPRGIVARFVWQPKVMYGVAVGAAFTLCMTLLSQKSEFLYFQF